MSIVEIVVCKLLSSSSNESGSLPGNDFSCSAISLTLFTTSIRPDLKRCRAHVRMYVKFTWMGSSGVSRRCCIVSRIESHTKLAFKPKMIWRQESRTVVKALAKWFWTSELYCGEEASRSSFICSSFSSVPLHNCENFINKSHRINHNSALIMFNDWLNKVNKLKPFAPIDYLVIYIKNTYSVKNTVCRMRLYIYR